MTSTLTTDEARRMMLAHPQAFGAANRDLLRDKSYQLLPLGMEAAAFMRAKRKQLTKGSQRKYESALDKLARYFPDLELSDFEPPVGTTRLEEFMEAHWGQDVAAPRTYNSNLSAIKQFFKWAAARGELHGDPAMPILRAKARDPYRETFSLDQFRAIIACQEDLRDRTESRYRRPGYEPASDS